MQESKREQYVIAQWFSELNPIIKSIQNSMIGGKKSIKCTRWINKIKIIANFSFNRSLQQNNRCSKIMASESPQNGYLECASCRFPKTKPGCYWSPNDGSIWLAHTAGAKLKCDSQHFWLCEWITPGSSGALPPPASLLIHHHYSLLICSHVYSHFLFSMCQYCSQVCLVMGLLVIIHTFCSTAANNHTAKETVQ